MPRVRSIPLTIIGGFLGSGKTTLLNRLLAHDVACGGRPGVIVNEIGDAEVDGDIIDRSHRKRDVLVSALSGGCVCCDAELDLVGALRELLGLDAVSSLWLETSGLASLAQASVAVWQALQGSDLTRRVHLARVIGVADASRLTSADSVYLASADVVVLNHQDALHRGARERVRTCALAAAPHAALHETRFARLSAEDVMNVRRKVRPFTKLPVASTTADFVSSTFMLLEPIDLMKLGALFARHASWLVRAKGFVREAGSERVCRVQWRPGQLDIVHERRPVAEPRLVAVGRDPRWGAFMDGLSACCAGRDSASSIALAQVVK